MFAHTHTHTLYVYTSISHTLHVYITHTSCLHTYITHILHILHTHIPTDPTHIHTHILHIQHILHTYTHTSQTTTVESEKCWHQLHLSLLLWVAEPVSLSVLVHCCVSTLGRLDVTLGMSVSSTLCPAKGPLNGGGSMKRHPSLGSHATARVARGASVASWPIC